MSGYEDVVEEEPFEKYYSELRSQAKKVFNFEDLFRKEIEYASRRQLVFVSQIIDAIGCQRMSFYKRARDRLLRRYLSVWV